MTGLITLLVRFRAVRKNSSKTPTGLTPLEGMKKAVLFLDNKELSCLRDMKKADAFFAGRGIRLESYEMGVDRSDVNIFGFFRKKKKLPFAIGDEDLFISLLTKDPFAVEYAARVSGASFKIGRSQLRGKVYDLIFTDPLGVPFSQSDALAAVLDFLSKVK